MSASSLTIPNLLLRDDCLVDETLLGADTLASTLPHLAGHFALRRDTGAGEVFLARDALGVNKLFFAAAGDGVDVANYFIDLVRRGHSPNRIGSVPSGHLVRLHPARRELELHKYSTLTFASETPAPEAELPFHAERIRTRLEGVFQGLAGALAGRPLYLTLSGGLDSTTIAVLARQYLGRFTAVTFATETADGSVQATSDLHFAERVAATLDIPLEIVVVQPAELLGLLDEVLLYGQDYRDFNVHCGLVNAALAVAIEKLPRLPGAGRPVVLTGDTMNELMADYTPVQYGSSTYYALPGLSPGRLRRFLVAGLDAGDREVGIFARHGIDTVQPYALCAHAYTSVPGAFLNDDRAKQRLVRLMMGARIPSFIYDRPKVRAQVADSNQVGGTMAALLDRGIDKPQLEQRFCELSGFERADLAQWIRAGMYRCPTTYPTAD